jgi:hypothetical protein
VFGGEELLSKIFFKLRFPNELRMRPLASKWQELDISLNDVSQKQKFNKIF